MAEIAVAPVPELDATVAIPGSRSLTNRALVCAALQDMAQNQLDPDTAMAKYRSNRR